MRWLVVIFLSVVTGIAGGLYLTWNWGPEYFRLKRAVPYYEPLKNSLYRALAENDFAHMFASDADLMVLRREFGFLEAQPTTRSKVVELIRWIDSNTKADEVPSIRALDLYAAKSGACEIHALAIATLAAFDIRARWIGTVKSSIGFGYLEAFVDGKWELFRLRSGKEDPSLHKSAWDLYQESEPSLSIRNFWWKPNQSWTSWKGSVYPVVLPFANVEEHPELKTVFQTDRGIHVRYRLLNPFDYFYGYFVAMDQEWTLDESLMEKFRIHLASEGMQMQRNEADWINWLGFTTYMD